jgi:hypothetical protein
MPTVLELLREGKNQELWEKCCGFINLTIEQFMTIQRRLLLEQIELLKDCKLGRQIMRGAKPRSLEEFRQKVPLTRYAERGRPPRKAHALAAYLRQVQRVFL